jgi:hypothetical protein
MSDPTTAVSAQARVRRKGDVLFSATDKEILALDVVTGDCFAFAGPSARIWELLEQPISASEAAGRLIEEYAVDADACRSEVLAHIQKLHGEGLVEIVDPAA